MSTPGKSSYLAHLPAVFQDDVFLGRYLLAFEQVLTGLDGTPGIEQRIEKLADLFRPRQTPDDFLPWLARWFALSLWREAREQGVLPELLRQAATLYRRRGTREGLRQVLELFLGKDANVTVEDGAPLPPHFFRVTFTLRTPNPSRLARMTYLARTIISQEKPAHTFYGLRILYPAMQIINDPTPTRPGLHIGQNTILGTIIASP